jgi:hypothetical protein
MKKTEIEAMERLHRILPELKTTKTIGLNKSFFRGLTDLEFTLLYQMPNLIIKAAPSCINYIDLRRKRLELPKQYTR